jgi:hypothetical protein
MLNSRPNATRSVASSRAETLGLVGPRSDKAGGIARMAVIVVALISQQAAALPDAPDLS